MNVSIKIERGSNVPGLPVSVNTYVDDRLHTSVPCEDRIQARAYAKGLDEGYRLAKAVLADGQPMLVVGVVDEAAVMADE